MALSKMDGIASVVVDTTARAVIRMKSDKAPTVEAINKALGKRLSVKKVEKTSFDKTHEVYTVSVKGLG